MIALGDDGTMDTVLYCTECGEEMRYNYDPSGPFSDDASEESIDEQADMDAYDAWIDECIEDATADHDCERESE